MVYRHNISITDKEIEEALLKEQNMSKFVEQCIRFYLEQHTKSYAELDDINQLDHKVEILNRNYLEVKDILNEIIKEFVK